jgi:hypothetical protein
LEDGDWRPFFRVWVLSVGVSLCKVSKNVSEEHAFGHFLVDDDDDDPSKNVLGVFV